MDNIIDSGEYNFLEFIFPEHGYYRYYETGEWYYADEAEQLVGPFPTFDDAWKDSEYYAMYILG